MPRSLDLIYSRINHQLKANPNSYPISISIPEISTREIGNWDIDEENKCNRKDLVHLLIRDGFLVSEKEDPEQHYLILELTKIM